MTVVWGGLSPPPGPSSRSVYQWPFGVGAWPNVPLGDAANYGGGVTPRTGPRLWVDENPVFMQPSAPSTRVEKNDPSGNRCVGSGTLLTVPLASSFVLADSSHNYEWAAVGSNGSDRYEGGQFARCSAGGPATAGHGRLIGSLTDAAIGGGSGGSGMTTLGGTLRLGELVPGGAIRHVIRGNLCGHTDFYPSPQPWVWPAVHADSYALDHSDPRHYGGSVPGLVPGCLLAIPPSRWSPALLHTDAARILGLALVLYGFRPANDSGRLVTWTLCCEVGPLGSVQHEFEQAWGFQLHPAQGSPWEEDVVTLLSWLHLVTNDGPDSIGGPGNRLAPYAPPFS